METNLKFNSGLRKRSSTKRAIIHHSASADVSAATIHQWHLNQGWSGIGYQFVIRANGAIERGRPEWAIGSHSGPKGNGDSIGIVLAGNFEIDKPTEAQMASLAWLIKEYLEPKYGELKILGHKDVMATACPGAMFPWAKLNEMLKGEVKTMVEKWKTDIIKNAAQEGLIDANMGHQPDEPASKWFVLAVCLNLLKKTERRKIR